MQHRNCADLLAHHGQAGVDNACVACGALPTKSIGDSWQSWDGSFSAKFKEENLKVKRCDPRWRCTSESCAHGPLLLPGGTCQICGRPDPESLEIICRALARKHDSIFVPARDCIEAAVKKFDFRLDLCASEVTSSSATPTSRSELVERLDKLDIDAFSPSVFTFLRPLLGIVNECSDIAAKDGNVPVAVVVGERGSPSIHGALIQVNTSRGLPVLLDGIHQIGPFNDGLLAMDAVAFQHFKAIPFFARYVTESQSHSLKEFLGSETLPPVTDSRLFLSHEEFAKIVSVTSLLDSFCDGYPELLDAHSKAVENGIAAMCKGFPQLSKLIRKKAAIHDLPQYRIVDDGLPPPLLRPPHPMRPLIDLEWGGSSRVQAIPDHDRVVLKWVEDMVAYTPPSVEEFARRLTTPFDLTCEALCAGFIGRRTIHLRPSSCLRSFCDIRDDTLHGGGADAAAFANYSLKLNHTRSQRTEPMRSKYGLAVAKLEKARVVNTDSRTQAVLMSAITEQLQRVEAEIDRQRGMLTGAAQLQVDGRIIRSTDGVRGIYRREYIGGIHRLEEAAPAWIHTLAAADLSSRAQRIGRGAFPSRTFPSRTVVPQMQFFINAPPPLPLRRDRESERARTRARGTLLSQQQRSQRRTFRTNSIPRRSASSRGR